MPESKRDYLWQLLVEYEDDWVDPQCAKVDYHARYKVNTIRPYKAKSRHYKKTYLQWITRTSPGTTRARSLPR